MASLFADYLMGMQMTEIENMYHQYLPEGTLQLQDLESLVRYVQSAYRVFFIFIFISSF